jgi:hypothetical protein
LKFSVPYSPALPYSTCIWQKTTKTIDLSDASGDGETFEATNELEEDSEDEDFSKGCQVDLLLTSEM